MDPPADEFPEWTPYHYVHNNPLRYTDPTGMSADDIIDIDKKTGNIIVTEVTGDDVVRLVDNGKVEDSYTYGSNGSFTAENKLVTGMEGQAILSTNSTKANQLFEFAANANVAFGIVDLKGGVSIVPTSPAPSYNAHT